MKLAPLSKLENKNTMTLKKFSNNVITENYDAIVIFQMCRQFGVIHEPDSGCSITFNFSLIAIFYQTKAGNRTNYSLTQFPYYSLKNVLFLSKNSNFYKINADVGKT